MAQQDTIVTGSKLTAIANAIRTRGGTQAQLTLDQMPQAIEDIPEGGGGGGGGGGATVTGRVTSMDSAFKNNAQITALDLSSYNTRGMTTMANAFANCTSLASIDLTGFDTTTVTTMYSLFYNCPSIVHVDLGDFDTPALTNIGRCFYGCTSLQTVNLAQLDTSLVTSASQPFNNCNQLAHVIWSQKSTVQPIPTNGTAFLQNSSTKIYVPNDLVASYKAASNWSSIANQIYSINDLPAAVADRYAGRY